MSRLETVIFGVAVVVALVVIGALFFAFLAAENVVHQPGRVPGGGTFDEALRDNPAHGRSAAEVDSNP
jgi:hypothetical protein